MNNDTARLNTLWAQLIVEELVRNGVDLFVISPGSRSAPLTVAAARHPKAKTVVHYDERGAAFFALGAAKALGAPCALVCTSGTAVANYFPAIVEASMAYVPLVVLTADRPPELQNTGANQTIDQTRIFGEYVRHFVAMPCPDEKIPLEFVLTTIDRAAAAASRPPGGPVHINCAYREPLAPADGTIADLGVSGTVARWLESGRAYTQWKRSDDLDSNNEAESLASEFIKTERLLVLVGQDPDLRTQEHTDCALDLFGAATVFADVASGARTVTNPIQQCVSVPNYDLLLLSPRFREWCVPEMVVHIGGRFVSKRVMEHLGSVRPARYIHVADHADRLDPGNVVTQRIHASPACFTASMLPDGESPPSPWAVQIRAASRRAEDVVSALLDSETSLTEPLVAHLVGQHLRGGAPGAVFAGNSMPVRNLDMYGGPFAPQARVVVNRGASGIDGNIATAAGYAKASGLHVTALVGDLAALHDLNSLALLKQDGVRVTLLVLNNDGGGIFHYLPIAEHGDVFEKYFATPHGMRFEDAARMFGLPYARPTTKDAFVDALERAHASDASSIIEAVTNRDENLRLHKKISEAVVKALEDL